MCATLKDSLADEAWLLHAGKSRKKESSMDSEDQLGSHHRNPGTLKKMIGTVGDKWKGPSARDI